jgi:DNA-binding transcriptional regulator GbsR (MarR family)
LEPREEKRDGDRHRCFIAEDDVSNFARAIMSSSTWMYTRPST